MSRRVKKVSQRDKINWITAVIVLAAIALLVFASEREVGVIFEKLVSFKDGIIHELWADEPAYAEVDQQSDGEALDRLRVHFIDVGQGKSILIEAPEKTVLIDAGENNRGETVLRYLAKHKIKRLDIAIGTHPHSDHIGGLDTVIHALPVDKVILPVIPGELSPTSPAYIDLLNEIAAKNLKITPAKPGDEYDLGGASLKILGPVKDDYLSLNEFSIVSRLDYGSTSFLFTGDSTAESEIDMLEAGARLRASVLDIGHHGSRDSSSEAFLKAVRPRVAVISCAVDNSYGHPHRQVMQRLETIGGVKILRTDLDGSVIILSDGRIITYETENTR